MEQNGLKIFLSYNRQNQPIVKNIAQKLATIGFDTSLELFFDADILLPSDNWIKEIENALSQSQVCLVFIGEQGIGEWQNKEVLKAVNLCVNSKGSYRIIPVILPHENRNLAKSFPWFLADYQWIEFTDANDSFAFGKLVEGIQKNEKGNGVTVSDKNPYKGLDYFNVDDAVFFFGRTFDLNWIFYKKLRLSTRKFTDRFLAIVGDSGSGKSSFARAGILAALEAGKYEGSDTWKQIITEPEDRPLLKLSTVLQKQGIISDSSAFDENAKKNKDGLRRVVEVYDEKIVLLIDQFEEVITQCKDEEERSAYLSNLKEAVKSGKLLLLVTLRSDFYASFSKYGEFADMLESNNFTLSGLDFTECNTDWEKHMKDIIEMPAKLLGVKVEPALTRNVLEEIKSIHGVLPVLQMALSALWKERKDKLALSINDYDTLSEGKGINGIVEKHSEKVYDSYTLNQQDNEKISLLKCIFLRLVEITDTKEDVRKTITKDDLIKELQSRWNESEINDALNFLSGAEARLLRIREDEQKQAMVEVVHEVLIRKWERLKAWVNEKRVALRYRIFLQRDITAWKENNNNADFLYTGKKLEAMEKWSTENQDLKTSEIENFIKKSRKRVRNRRNKGIIFALIVLGIASIGLKLYSTWQFYNTDFGKSYRDRNINLLGLTSITIKNKSDLQYLSHLKSLDSLFINSSDIDNLDKVKNLKKLKHLTLEKCNLISSLSGIENLEHLTSLELTGLNNLKDLAPIKELKQLTSLELADLGVQDLSPIKDFKQLTSLKVSFFDVQNLSPIKDLKQLTSLELANIFHLQDLSPIKDLQQLSSLKVTNFDSTHNLSGIENLKQLTSFELSGFVHDLSPEDLKKLTSLKLSALEDLQQLSSLKLSSLDDLRNLSGIENLTHLTSLQLYELGVQDLSPIKDLKQLTSLELSDLDIRDLSPIKDLNQLTSLALYGLGVQDLSPIKDLKQLTSLALSSLGVQDLSPIKDLKQLTSLGLSYLDVQDLSPIKDLKQLTSLELSGLGFQDLSPIKDLKQLTSLKLSYFDKLHNLSGIENLKHLTSLELTWLPNVQDLSPIKDLKLLTSLKLHLPNVQDLSPLKNLKQLTSLRLTNLKNLKDLSGIEKLINLKKFYFFYRAEQKNEIGRIKKALPNCELNYLDSFDPDDP